MSTGMQQANENLEPLVWDFSFFFLLEHQVEPVKFFCFYNTTDVALLNERTLSLADVSMKFGKDFCMTGYSRSFKIRNTFRDLVEVQVPHFR